jgi:hypothetical protein
MPGSPKKREKLRKLKEEIRKETRTKVMANLKPRTSGLSDAEVELLASWIETGNITESAKVVGLAPGYARERFAKNPVLKQIAGKIRKGIETTLQEKVEEYTGEWMDLLSEAKGRLRSLMLEARDEKVQLWAAQYIVDRAQGKATAKVDHRIVEYKAIPDEGVMQLALSIVHQEGLSLPAALEYIRQHPDEVEEWKKTQALLSIPEAEWEEVEPDA